MACIHQQNTHLQRTTQTSKQAQLIYDEETNRYLNFRQLMQHQIKIISKQVWKINQWTQRREGETNQHNLIHSKRRSLSQQNERCDVRQFQLWP